MKILFVAPGALGVSGEPTLAVPGEPVYPATICGHHQATGQVCDCERWFVSRSGHPVSSATARDWGISPRDFEEQMESALAACGWVGVTRSRVRGLIAEICAIADPLPVGAAVDRAALNPAGKEKTCAGPA